MKRYPIIFVIIVTYNGKQWYDQCFQSLRNSLVPVQTVVIDNASSDDTVVYIKNTYPEIHLIESDENLGFGQANNLGIKYALDLSGDYVFLLNQDAWIEPNTIFDLIRIHKENQQFGILSPMHLNATKNAIEKGLMHYIADYRTTSTDLVNDLYFNNLQDVYETQYVNAAVWLLPIKTIKTVGGFDPIFFHYGEDDNYMQRVIYHGMKIGICPRICAMHDTERRLTVSNQNTIKTKEKEILVELANINKPLYIKKLLFYHLSKMLFKFFALKINAFKYHFEISRILFRYRKSIVKSRLQNVSKNISWI